MRNTKIVKTAKLLRLVARTFGLRGKYILLFSFNIFLGWINSFFFLCDRLFFPSQKSKELDRPIILIGHLRSGTTFLHRFLSKNCSEFSSFNLWEMIFPSLTLKKLLKPLVPLISKISLDRVYDPKIHKTGLNKEETDDIALYFRYLDGMLSWIYFRAWHKYDSTTELHTSIMDTCNQKKFVAYLRMVYRNISAQSHRRVISKSFSALFYIDELLKENPSARIIILIRDPNEAIPSLMSLEESVQNNLHGKKRVVKNRNQYFENLYDLSVLYYATLDRVYQKYRDRKEFLFISYPELLSSFESSMRKIVSHCEISKTKNLDEAIAKQSAKQGTFKSEHAYSLERFNLKEEAIKADIPFYNSFITDCGARL